MKAGAMLAQQQAAVDAQAAAQAAAALAALSPSANKAVAPPVPQQ